MSLPRLRVIFLPLFTLAAFAAQARAETFPLDLVREAGSDRSSRVVAATPVTATAPSGILAGLTARSAGRDFEPPPDGPSSPDGRELGLADLPPKLRADLRALVLAPTEWRGREWRRFGLGVGLVLASSVLDEPVHAALDEDRTSAVDRFADGLRPLGQEAGILLFAGAWAAGRVSHRPRWVAVGQDGLEASLIASGLIVPALKTVSGRPRPRDSHAIEERFGLFGGDQSFPSGEATQAFALASVLASHAESGWVRGAAYGVAGLLAANRIAVDAHWTSDVVAGALIGTAIGRWVVRRRDPAVEPSEARRLANWTIGPTVGPSGSGQGLAIRWTF